MATTKIECVHILNLWIGMERLFDSCARQVLKTCQVRSSVVRQHDVVGARRLIITLGRERWAESTKDLASALDKSADWVTYIQREGSEVKILLGTDALSEGLNLQTCGKLINYDLPWNFMRVEQRIVKVPGTWVLMFRITTPCSPYGGGAPYAN
jgi:hypothetical protein